MIKLQAKSEMEKLFFSSINAETPDQIKNNPLINLDLNDSFEFKLKKNYLYRNSNDPRPLSENEYRSDEGLGLLDWFSNYEKESKVSTAGIRGLQNPLYPWDTRYPINLVGMSLATLGKILVLIEKYPNDISKIYKLVAGEVRYNTPLYIELISRIHAAYGIKVYRLPPHEVMPIWMASFLIYTQGFYGGEYVTSSHALSKKIATKDLNFQGSQYVPEESALFVDKIRSILREVEVKGEYTIKFSGKESHLIDDKYLISSQMGIPKYVEYLKNTIAIDRNLNDIRESKHKIFIECMGGSMYKPLDSIMKLLSIRERFDFINPSPDSFFHGIGKIYKNGKFEDLGCDSSILKIDLKTGDVNLPVIETMNYQEKFKSIQIGTCILMTDPDGDRLITSQVESSSRKALLKERGIAFIELDNEKILVVYMPNQSFLMNLNYYYEMLKQQGFLTKYNWFMIKTTPSAMSWDEWAKSKNIPVVNTPVGFKEIATIIQKIESKYLSEDSSARNISVKDVMGNTLELGDNPRLLFAGEESGGEIFGSHELIQSINGRSALAMREKSAGEAILITSSMIANFSKTEKFLSDYLFEIFEENNIQGRYDVRVDKKYYNESEPDINKLRSDKELGIGIRTSNDMYFLSIALSYRLKYITIQQVREILSEAFPSLDFSDLDEIYFVGDGTYLRFKTKFVEIRPSGTDAINKAYAAGNDYFEAVKFANEFAEYDGKRNSLHRIYIKDEVYNKSKETGIDLLINYQEDENPHIEFTIHENRLS